MEYSKDLKYRVIEIMARDEMSVRKAARYFNVCIQTIQNLKKSTVSKPIPGRPAKISRAQILKDVEQYPDDYQYERSERLVVSVLHAAEISRKKRRWIILKRIKIDVSNFKI